MTKIDETIEEALPILTIDEFRQAVQAVETLRHRRPQTEDEWREEIVRSGIRLNREAKDLLATELASASIQVQDAWFQRKWERERQAAIEARKQAETLALLNKHPLNQRAEELLRIVEENGPETEYAPSGPSDDMLHVLTLMWWGIEAHPEWANDLVWLEESSDLLVWRILVMGRDLWKPQDVMAMLMVQADSLDSLYEEWALGAEGLDRETPENAAWTLIDTLMMNAMTLKMDPDALPTEALTRKWLRMEKNLSQSLRYLHQQENMETPQKTLWGGRFSTSLTTETVAFTQSVEADTRLIGYDIWGSQAHAIMLARQGIIAEEDLREILRWLQKAEEDFKNGTLTLDPSKEDVHMNVESYLIENAGREFGGKLHTARSRNDQVLVDARLYIREEILNVQRGLSALCDAFLKIAEEHTETVMPGYTHTQHAQPISLGFWASAYVSMFLRDQKRLQSAYALANTNPLGACALAGTTFPIDRHLTTKLLGFDAPHEHALDVISSRDFIAETLFALSLVMANLSRISEEIVYWTTYEFGMAVLDDAYSFGSSIMPQKKNPDIAELTRGRTGRVYGALFDLLTNLKGLPMGYNRDFQEDKPPLWDAFDIVKACLGVLPELLETTDFREERMAELANANFATATELANYLVTEHNISFRECHEIVGWLVGELVKQDKTFADWEATQCLLKEKGIEIPIAQLQQILDAALAIRNNRSLGGTSPDEVHRMCEVFEEQLNEIALQIYTRQTQIDDAHRETLRTVEEVLKQD